MAATPADIKEYPNSYVFVVDMPGLKVGDIKVQVEDDNVLLISGERKREEEKEGAKYDGVLTVTVQKLPPPEPKKPKVVEVKVN
ncbi:17.9 kDa class II heat shock protein, partial [Cucurbita argyrosperma subsp. sororia]